MKCNICAEHVESVRKLVSHLQYQHKISSKQYTIDTIHNGHQPVCLECGDETRYVSFTFKKYCKAHSKMAMSVGGRVGGRSTAWNKGETKETSETLKRISKEYSGSGNPFYGKTHKVSIREKLGTSSILEEAEFQKRIELRADELVLKSSYEEYRSRQNQYLKFDCILCHSESLKTLIAFERGSKCKICFPDNSNSTEQIELKTFLTTLQENILENVRSVISPKELDLYAPDKKFAIEYNGLYWHTEEFIDKKKHRLKTEECLKLGINLFHVFSDEWLNKPEIIKSMIRHRLGKTENRIHGRKCIVKEIKVKEAKPFLEANHLDGYARATNKYGLFYRDELISVVTTGTPRYKGRETVEIIRFATKLNHHAVGGFSKLLKVIKSRAKTDGKSRIITYADLRHGTGGVYDSFEKIGDTKISYWYTDWKTRFPRQHFMADKSRGMSEKEVAAEAGVYKIYGCGSYLFEMKL